MNRDLVAAGLLLLISGNAFAADPAADAHATLDRWVVAQNVGSFSDYAELYAKRFTGVKRSRTRTTSFDRAGWLEDRERMFQKKMTVEATKVRVLSKEKTALIVFTQRWSSGNYSDVGEKQLVLRRGPGPTGYQIERSLGGVYIDVTGPQTPVYICPC